MSNRDLDPSKISFLIFIIELKHPTIHGHQSRMCQSPQGSSVPQTFKVDFLACLQRHVIQSIIFPANDPWKSPPLSNAIVANPESAFLPFKGPPEKLQTSNNTGLFDSQMDSFSIDPFAPLAQKELQDYDVRRGEIENRNDPFQVKFRASHFRNFSS
jgi:hypothetical protein